MNENENENENVNENGNNNNNNNNNNENDYRIKQLNDHFKIIDASKSFEDQIKLLKKACCLNEYRYMKYYDDKELNLKIFKLKFAYVSNDINEKLFEQIFGHTFVTLANKLINTTNKGENQIIVNDIEKNNDKLYEKKKNSHDFVIEQNYIRVDLINALNLNLDFNKTIQLDLV